MFCPDRLCELSHRRAAQSFFKHLVCYGVRVLRRCPGVAPRASKRVGAEGVGRGATVTAPPPNLILVFRIGFVFESIFRCAQQTTALFLQVLRMRFARFSPHSHPPVSMTNPQCPLFCCAPPPPSLHTAAKKAEQVSYSMPSMPVVCEVCR